MYIESENVVNLDEQHDLRDGGIIKRQRSSRLQAILGTAYMSQFQESFTYMVFVLHVIQFTYSMWLNNMSILLIIKTGLGSYGNSLSQLFDVLTIYI